MNSISKTLLAGAAFGALATAPAVADNVPNLNFTALHRSNVVHKTRMTKAGHGEDCSRICTGSTVSTYIPASDLDKKVNLIYTFYKWNSNNTICSQPKEKIHVVPKKSQYAQIGTATETYSIGCSGPTVFYGDTYKLKNPAGEGKTDSFVSTLIGKFWNNGVKYKGALILDVNVNIGE
jgi:hypothetical protein